MKVNKIQNTHYLILSYNSLIKNKIVHIFLFLMDVCILLLQILEIYYNHYKSLCASDFKSFSFISLIMKDLNKLKIGIKFAIYISLIIIETFFGYILNNFNLTMNSFWIVVINLNEILFQRIGVLFMFNFLFSFNGIFLIIGIIVSLPYLIILIGSFRTNHLFTFFFKLVYYPYDVFSKVIDLLLLLMKILIALSGMSNSDNLSKLFFIFTIFVSLFLPMYLSYLMIYKSYYLMNNVFLNKIRYSTLLSNCIIILLVLIIKTNEISNTYLIICFPNMFILCFILIWIFYDPYQFIKFETDDNEENAFYYFFVLDREKNKNLLLEMKIEEHRNNCGRCNLCKKYSDAKIQEKFENVDLYDIIYNNKNSALNLMNKIIRDLKKQKKEKSLTNNSFFLINLIYIYYMGISQNDYCFFLNTELLYHLLSNQNDQYLEEYKIHLNRIKYTNNFLVRANEILENFNNIIDEKKIEKKYEILFNFADLLGGLKFKEIKNNSNYLNNNSNNGNTITKNLNCNNLLTICSLFYEELYNESTSSSRLYIRDSQNVLEDLINNNNKNKKFITFEIIAHNFQVKIIRAGGYLNKYENTYLFDLFPEIFKTNQIMSMKKILLTSNSSELKDIKNNESNELKNNDNEKQYLIFSFLIEEKHENEIYFKLLNLQMNFVALKDIQTTFYLNGIYKIDKDIIITEQRKDVETLLHFGNHEQEKMIEGISKEKKIIIKQRHGYKYLGNKKLVEDENSLKGSKHYKVYHFLLPFKKNVCLRTTKSELNNLINEYNNDKINNSSNDDKIIFNDLASQSSSTASSNSKKNLMLYNRENKQSQNEEDISNGLLCLKYALYIGIIILPIIFIIEYVSLKLSNSNLSKIVNFYLELTNFFLIYNRLFCSITSLSCLGVSPYSKECHNGIHNYSIYLMESAANESNLGIDKNNLEDYFLDIEKILFEEELVLLKMMDESVSSLSEYLSDISDKQTMSLFEENVLIYKITQIDENNIPNLFLKEDALTFIDSILLINSRINILTKDFENLKEPIYIMDKIDVENSLINVNKDETLNNYQENFYLLFLDDDDFFVYFNNTIYKIEEIIQNKENKIKTYIFFIFGINAFLYSIILFFLFWYIRVHLSIIFQIMMNIYTYMNEKLGEIVIKDIMRKKIDNLKLILSFYERDINTTINELNLTYNKYIESYNLKLKEESKHVKKEVKNEKNDPKNNNSFFGLFNFKYFRIFFTYSTKKNMYIYSLIFVIIVIILLFIIFIIVWILFFKKDGNIMNWVHLSNEIVRSNNDLMANFLIMIYTNQSIIEASDHLDTKDYRTFLYEKLTYLYSIGGYLDQVQDYILYDENSINFDCKGFYKNMNNSVFAKLAERITDLNDSTKFYYTLETFCEQSNITIFNNYKTTYMQFFNYIENLMENFICGNYEEIYNFVFDNNIAQVEIFFFIVYSYLVEMLNDNINNIYKLIVKEIDNNLDIMVIIFLIGFIHLASSVYIIFNRNLDKDCQSFIQLRKIFKVCNISE